MLSELEYEVLERFAIMPTEGNICDEQAGFEIEKKYGRFWKDWILRKMRLIQKSKEACSHPEENNQLELF